MDTNQSQQSYWFAKTVECKMNDIGKTSYTYDKLRKMTEVLYIIREYLPIVFNNNIYCYKTFTVTLYEDMQKIYDEIYTNKLLFQKSNEKTRIVNILLEEMRNVEDILIPLLPETYTSTHLVKCVTEDYMKLRKSKNHILFVYENE
jgi:hypothetical protein